VSGRFGWSLLTRLVWIAAGAAVASLIFGGLAMYRAISIENDHMLDARLEQFGATLQALVDETEIDGRRGALIGQPQIRTRPTAALLYRYQVWSRHGRLLMRSHEAPAERPMVRLGQLGYSAAQIDGEAYRVFSLPSRSGEYVIQVAENLEEAWIEIGLTTAYYAIFLVLPFGLVLLATWWLLRRALRAINLVADDLRQRNPLELEPIDVSEPPRELVPILGALETLFGRMRRALSVERSFTSLAAHEMRTPLAGLRAQAQLLAQEELPAEQKETVAALLTGVDRSAHMVDQLLDLARVEGLSLSGEPSFEYVHVAEVYHAVRRELAPAMRRRQVSVSAQLGDLALRCHAFALSVLLRNLLANAVLYSPVGGRVELRGVPEDNDLVLTVDDSGPGIPPAQRDHAFERFNRLGRSQADGVGIGLSIVLMVVELHGARIQLDQSPLGGLRVTVRFPGSASAPAHAVSGAEDDAE
jgi:signal transduction histidine kinase